MKTVEFKCNLCGDKKDYNEISGIYFIGQVFEYREPHSCNTHLCHDCIDTINRLGNVEKKCSIAP